eukprot:795438-Rhodomonas_salina.1
MANVVLRGDSSAQALLVNVHRLVHALAEFRQDAMLNAVLMRNGVAIDGQEVDSRLQEWKQAGVVVP